MVVGECVRFLLTSRKDFLARKEINRKGEPVLERFVYQRHQIGIEISQYILFQRISYCFPFLH